MFAGDYIQSTWTDGGSKDENEIELQMIDNIIRADEEGSRRVNPSLETLCRREAGNGGCQETLHSETPMSYTATQQHPAGHSYTSYGSASDWRQEMETETCPNAGQCAELATVDLCCMSMEQVSCQPDTPLSPDSPPSLMMTQWPPRSVGPTSPAESVLPSADLSCYGTECSMSPGRCCAREDGGIVCQHLDQTFPQQTPEQQIIEAEIAFHFFQTQKKSEHYTDPYSSHHICQILHPNHEGYSHLDEVEISPSKTKTKRCRKCLKLWHFILHQLENPRPEAPAAVVWVDRDRGIFDIVDPELLTGLWKQRKNKPHASSTFDCLKRALRNYYKDGIMVKVQRKSNLYQFQENADMWKQALMGFPVELQG